MTTKYDKPITSAEEARAFIVALHAEGRLFHFDDAPEDIINGETDEPLFSKAEADDMEERVGELFAFLDPNEVALELLNVD